MRRFCERPLHTSVKSSAACVYLPVYLLARFPVFGSGRSLDRFFLLIRRWHRLQSLRFFACVHAAAPLRVLPPHLAVVSANSRNTSGVAPPPISSAHGTNDPPSRSHAASLASPSFLADRLQQFQIRQHRLASLAENSVGAVTFARCSRALRSRLFRRVQRKSKKNTSPAALSGINPSAAALRSHPPSHGTFLPPAATKSGAASLSQGIDRAARHRRRKPSPSAPLACPEPSAAPPYKEIDTAASPRPVAPIPPPARPYKWVMHPRPPLRALAPAAILTSAGRTKIPETRPPPSTSIRTSVSVRILGLLCASVFSKPSKNAAQL